MCQPIFPGQTTGTRIGDKYAIMKEELLVTSRSVDAALEAITCLNVVSNEVRAARHVCDATVFIKDFYVDSVVCMPGSSTRGPCTKSGAGVVRNLISNLPRPCHVRYLLMPA